MLATRAAWVASIVMGVGLLGQRGADARVTVTPTSSPAGQPVALTFRVPNEPGGARAGHEIGAAAAMLVVRRRSRAA